MAREKILLCPPRRDIEKMLDAAYADKKSWLELFSNENVADKRPAYLNGYRAGLADAVGLLVRAGALKDWEKA